MPRAPSPEKEILEPVCAPPERGRIFLFESAVSH
jgi:hypothetical protein